MRVRGVALAGVLALSVPVTAHSASLGSNIGQAMTGLTPGVMQVGDWHGSNWHPAPGVGGYSPYSGPSRLNGGLGAYARRGVPTYWVYVPGSAVFDDPFPDWRDPTGGWGNP
jgi:hypothetical protein